MNSDIKSVQHQQPSVNKRASPELSQKANRRVVIQKPILSNKHTKEFRVIYEGEDLTPEPLNPLVYEGAKERQLSVFDTTDVEASQSAANYKLFQTQSTSRFYTEIHRQTLVGETFQQSISVNYADDVHIEPGRSESLREGTVDEYEDFPDFVPGEVPLTQMPTHISVVLAETPTFFLLDLPSKTVEKDTEEASVVEEDNARYEYLTEGKGRNRKMVNTEVQTAQILQKSRTTLAEKVRRKHNHAFASNWEMYDTFEKVTEPGVPVVREFLDDDYTTFEASPSVDSFMIPREERQMAKLMQNPKFLEAVCVIERLLANNNFNMQQKRFKGLSDPSPFREDIEYKYRLDLLWTFANENTQGRCVTAMCWNDANMEILAVGYGKFYYTERTTGMVMIWNIKNPVQPERTYYFAQPVTAINFSQQNPNVLGVGFYDGTVRLLDVSARELRVIGKSGKDSPICEPIWQIVWFQASEYFKDEEQIITTSEDGRISFYRTQEHVELMYSQIMRIPRAEGNMKGIEALRRCHVPGISVTRYTGALVIQQHPADMNIYYVGTSEGTIHKCSKNYYHQHLDVFLAHDGPLYGLKFSPFCNRLFLTCGDDWHVRIWADGIVEPLFELSKTMQSVQGADWSPTHSTIIANICGSDIYIWDLQRKTHLPQSVTNSPTNCRNTVVQFTKSGRCLVVGDIEGNVHIFALEDMPFPAFFQDDLLSNSLARALKTRPDLIRQLRKMGSLNFDQNMFKKHFQ